MCLCASQVFHQRGTAESNLETKKKDKWTVKTFSLATFMSFGVSRKEDKFTGLWKAAQAGELLRQISTSVPDLHSVSSQSQRREKKEDWAMETARGKWRQPWEGECYGNIFTCVRNQFASFVNSLRARESRCVSLVQ